MGKIRTLLCCIGRHENQYIREYVEYYKKLGITNICLYDNNYDGEEHFEDVIGDYIDSGFVILKDYRNQSKCQIRAYEECYKEYSRKYNWICFFDCDEFLTFKDEISIDGYLSSEKFKKYNAIKINWMIYGDNNMLRNDGRPVTERLTEPIMPLEKKVTYNFPENNHIKTIVRGGLVSVKFMNQPHSTNVAKQCNASGIQAERAVSPFNTFDYEQAWLRHYSTKTAEEYADKMLRGFPDQIPLNQEKIKTLVETRFFNYNKITEEKINLFTEKLGIDFSYLLKRVNKRTDVQIFMLCYDKKEYEFLDDAVITPLQCGAANGKDVCELKDNTGDNISAANFIFVENTGIYWIWKNVKNADYKGNMQYRRRLQGINENTDFEKIFSQYDVICAKPYNYPENYKWIPANTVRDGYGFSHCVDDLDIMGEVVKELYPDYAEDWDKYIVNGQDLYYSSGFILPADKYDEYCQFMFNCSQGWLKKTGINNRDELIFHIARNLGAGKYPRYKMEGVDVMKTTYQQQKWQSYLLGFLGERLWTVFLNHNIPEEKRYIVDYEKTENIYI